MLSMSMRYEYEVDSIGINFQRGNASRQSLLCCSSYHIQYSWGTPAVEAEAPDPEAEEEAPAQEEPPPAAITQVLTKTFDGTTSTHRPSNTSTERPLEYFVWEETENCGRAMASQ